MSGDRIQIGCQPIDALLDGGLERGAVTQVYGPPAAGKTNIALSAATTVTTQGGTVVYIDTEGLSMARFQQMLEPQAAAANIDPETAAGRLMIETAHDFEEQRQAVKAVESLADSTTLIVLDSATGFYRLRRTDDTEKGDALRSVVDQITHLLGIARRNDSAVLLTNQVYTDPENDRAQPLGGHTLAHWTGTILRLDRFRGGNRRATLEKHRSKPTGETVSFRIVEEGIVADS